MLSPTPLWDDQSVQVEEKLATAEGRRDFLAEKLAVRE